MSCVTAPTPLPLYLGKTHVHTRPVGEKPFVEVESTNHPLAVEQRTGITVTRVRQIAEHALRCAAGRDAGPGQARESA